MLDRVSSPSGGPESALDTALARLEAALPQDESSFTLLQFLEDDLREGLFAAADVESHFQDILEALSTKRISPMALLNASDDIRVLQRLEYLLVVVAQLRRRLAAAAGKLRPAVKAP